MTALLTRLLGRLPIGWMQLLHNKARLIAAIGGVAFANILIFMQLGFMGALFETSVLSHRNWNADIVIASSDFQSLRQVNTLPRARMMQALAVEGVVDAAPFYLGSIAWTDPQTDQIINFRIVGVPLDQKMLRNPEIGKQKLLLREPMTALVDVETRQLNPEIVSEILGNGSYTIEIGGQTTELVGTFSEGASFDVDGSLIVSDQTFLQLFPRRESGTPTLVFVSCEPGTDLLDTAARINATFPETDARAYEKEAFIEAEQAFQSKQTPIGFVFSFGVVIGFIVGFVIVYQVLTTDVQDHLSEYATFKAIGYSPKFFFNIIFEEAIFLATLGFLPGMLISLSLYLLAGNATALPIEMPWDRPLLVLFLTILMCVGSGIIATRKLNAAQPADLF